MASSTLYAIYGLYVNHDELHYFLPWAVCSSFANCLHQLTNVHPEEGTVCMIGEYALNAEGINKEYLVREGKIYAVKYNEGIFWTDIALFHLYFTDFAAFLDRTKGSVELMQ